MRESLGSDKIINFIGKLFDTNGQLKLMNQIKIKYEISEKRYFSAFDFTS